MATFSVKQWKELFGDIGLKQADMDNWHTQFERKFPEAHQRFLQWLNLDAGHIEKIRTESK